LAGHDVFQRGQHAVSHVQPEFLAHGKRAIGRIFHVVVAGRGVDAADALVDLGDHRRLVGFLRGFDAGEGLGLVDLRADGLESLRVGFHRGRVPLGLPVRDVLRDHGGVAEVVCRPLRALAGFRVGRPDEVGEDVLRRNEPFGDPQGFDGLSGRQAVVQPVEGALVVGEGRGLRLVAVLRGEGHAERERELVEDGGEGEGGGGLAVPVADGVVQDGVQFGVGFGLGVHDVVSAFD